MPLQTISGAGQLQSKVNADNHGPHLCFTRCLCLSLRQINSQWDFKASRAFLLNSIAFLCIAFLFFSFFNAVCFFPPWYEGVEGVCLCLVWILTVHWQYSFFHVFFLALICWTLIGFSSLLSPFKTEQFFFFLDLFLCLEHNTVSWWTALSPHHLKRHHREQSS